jgi:hypothetical protein
MTELNSKNPPKLNRQIFYRNLSEVSFYFFISIGSCQILASMFYVNELFSKPAWLLSRILDTPFLFVSLIYLTARLQSYQLQPTQQNSTSNPSTLNATDLFILAAITLCFFLFQSYDLIFSHRL